MKKNYKIFAMLLLIINIIICFIPGYFYQRLWERGWPSTTLVAELGCSMFDVRTDDFQKYDPPYIFACFVVFCWVVCIGMILFSIIRNKDYKPIGYAPCICLAPFLSYIMAMLSATCYLSDGNRYINYSFNWLFYISLALQISSAALMIISIYAKDDRPLVFRRPANKISEAEELSKYKELLDNGVISQEEFEAKKKQLLGL